MLRRSFVQLSVGAWIGAARCRIASGASSEIDSSQFAATPVRSIIPVVGDGQWIWREPPQDQTGYLEPRPFQLSVGVELSTDGPARRLMATTAVPVELPEQHVDDVRLETQGCVAELRRLAPEAAQLALAAPAAAAGQIVRAIAHYRLTLCKAYQAHEKDKFPSAQQYPRDFRRLYLGDSPGIQTRDKIVRDLASSLTQASQHPWDRARTFYTWVWENIQGRIQTYTSVLQALQARLGDCEERAAVFVALCRASDIPARLVWVPNHNWAEFYLTDHEGQGHWIPAHTAAYSWFGWTGAHELVLQKGDAIRVPESHRPQRLISDWMQWQGAKPKVRYIAELTPLADEQSGAADPGPGARRKEENGEWKPVGDHPLDHLTRK